MYKLGFLHCVCKSLNMYCIPFLKFDMICFKSDICQKSKQLYQISKPNAGVDLYLRFKILIQLYN